MPQPENRLAGSDLPGLPDRSLTRPENYKNLFGYGKGMPIWNL